MSIKQEIVVESEQEENKDVHLVDIFKCTLSRLQLEKLDKFCSPQSFSECVRGCFVCAYGPCNGSTRLVLLDQVEDVIEPRKIFGVGMVTEKRLRLKLLGDKEIKALSNSRPQEDELNNWLMEMGQMGFLPKRTFLKNKALNVADMLTEVDKKSAADKEHQYIVVDDQTEEDDDMRILNLPTSSSSRSSVRTIEKLSDEIFGSSGIRSNRRSQLKELAANDSNEIQSEGTQITGRDELLPIVLGMSQIVTLFKKLEFEQFYNLVTDTFVRCLTGSTKRLDRIIGVVSGPEYKIKRIAVSVKLQLHWTGLRKINQISEGSGELTEDEFLTWIDDIRRRKQKTPTKEFVRLKGIQITEALEGIDILNLSNENEDQMDLEDIVMTAHSLQSTSSSTPIFLDEYEDEEENEVMVHADEMTEEQKLVDIEQDEKEIILSQQSSTLSNPPLHIVEDELGTEAGEEEDVLDYDEDDGKDPWESVENSDPLNACILSLGNLLELKGLNGFEELVTGCFVRVHNKRPEQTSFHNQFYMDRIVSISTAEKPYYLYKSDKHNLKQYNLLLCLKKFGSIRLTKIFRTNRTRLDDSSFKMWVSDMRKWNCKPPKEDFLLMKREQLQVALMKVRSSTNINLSKQLSDDRGIFLTREQIEANVEMSCMEDLDGCIVNRKQLVAWMNSAPPDVFVNTVVGCFVRVNTKKFGTYFVYKLDQVEEVYEGEKSYEIRDEPCRWVLHLRMYGPHLIQSIAFSNCKREQAEEEFKAWKNMMSLEGLKWPTKKSITAKVAILQNLQQQKNGEDLELGEPIDDQEDLRKIVLKLDDLMEYAALKNVDFKTMVADCFVRVLNPQGSTDENEEQELGFELFKIVDVVNTDNKYRIRNTFFDKMLVLDDQRQVPLTDISNFDFTSKEFERKFGGEYNLLLPTKFFVENKLKMMNEARGGEPNKDLTTGGGGPSTAKKATSSFYSGKPRRAKHSMNWASLTRAQQNFNGEPLAKTRRPFTAPSTSNSYQIPQSQSCTLLRTQQQRLTPPAQDMNDVFWRRSSTAILRPRPSTSATTSITPLLDRIIDRPIFDQDRMILNDSWIRQTDRFVLYNNIRQGHLPEDWREQRPIRPLSNGFFFSTGSSYLNSRGV